MSEGAPKSALELALERLKKKDAEQGIVEKPLTDAQREAIAEARRAHEARVAQRRIMHQSDVSSIFDPAQLAERDAELRRDLDRFEREIEEKVSRIRAGTP